MIAIFDNLTAMLIGSAVLLIMVGMNQRNQEVAIERSINYVAKKQAIEFGNWLQDDVANIGAGVAGGSPVLEVPEENAAGVTSRFTFYRKETAAAATPVEIEYLLAPRPAVTMQTSRGRDTTFTLYEIRRVVNGATAESGKSMPTITRFKVELLDRNGRVTTDAAAARQVRIGFSAVARFSERRKFLIENHWSTTVPLRAIN